MRTRSKTISWHEWSPVIETDLPDCTAFAHERQLAISHARSLDGLIQAVNRYADQHGLDVLLELEPRWDGLQDPNELRATFIRSEVQAAIA
jgi:hypothetical protein